MKKEKSIAYVYLNLRWLVITFFVIILDQWSKWWVVNHLYFGERRPWFPYVDLLLMPNRGAAYSFLQNAGGWQRWFFVSLASVISVVIIIWLARMREVKTLLAISLCLILGGALGNLIDRLHLAYVIDFISFYIGNWRFAIFNVADAAITVGAGLLIIDSIIHLGKEKKASDG